MGSKERVAATIVIWIVFAIISSTMLTSPTGAIANANGAAVFSIFLVMSIAAMVSTMAVWLSARGVEEVPASKAKRLQRSRVDKLIGSLNDDEIYELEARLLAEREEESSHGVRR